MSIGNPLIRLKNINPKYQVSQKPLKDVAYYLSGIAEKNHVILGETITLMESTSPSKVVVARQILNSIIETPRPERLRIGVTGPPGVGKSTWLNAFGYFVSSQGKSTAILAIDPSSINSKGSILGDKTRMDIIGRHSDVFIRPSPSGSVLGGISRNTMESLLVCEYAGFDYICIETVGVGQSEIAVAEQVDINILILQPGSGDDIQGIKRGIMETADIIVVNKADGALTGLADQTRYQFQSIIKYLHHQLPHWEIPVILTSGLQSKGFTEIMEQINKFSILSSASGYISEKRKDQGLKWFEQQGLLALQHHFLNNPKNKTKYLEITDKIKDGTLHPIQAIDLYLDLLG